MTNTHPVAPNLTVEDAAAAIDFYKKAFSAEERLRLEARRPDRPRRARDRRLAGDGL
jgi:uncharacterized glyoxalase superfamily protein PhnB